jgi:hypothetical protein
MPPKLAGGGEQGQDPFFLSHGGATTPTIIEDLTSLQLKPVSSFIPAFFLDRYHYLCSRSPMIHHHRCSPSLMLFSSSMFIRCWCLSIDIPDPSLDFFF